MTRTPTIVVVDDAVEVRSLVRARLRLSGSFEVVGEGSTGHDAIALATRLRPALLLLDVSMPGMDGLEALPVIREVAPETRVVMYSGFAEEGLAERTLQLGAAAYFEKSTSLETLATDLLALLDAPVDGPRAGTRPGLDEPVAVPAKEESYERVEPVLREHLERFREVFDDATIGMATMTLSGRVVRANHSLSRLTGRSVHELVAASWVDISGDEPRVRAILEKVASGAREAVQLEHGVAGDEDRRLLSAVSSVRDVQDRPLYLFLQVQDVSAQRGTEAELRVSEEQFRLLVEAVQDYAIFMLDPQGRIASWNAGAQRIKGWNQAEIVGQHFRVFYPEPKQLERHPERELELALRDGHYEEEGWRVRKDGSTFWAHVTITAVHDGDGRLVGYAKVTRDVTERLLLQQEKERSAARLATVNAQLESANHQLQQSADDQAHFLAVAAHELRSPVGVLGGTADLLHQHWPDLQSGEQKELLEGMTLSAGRLRRLLDDLLTSARIQAGATELDLQVLDLRPRLEAVVRTTARTLDAAVHLADGPALRVLGDRDRIAQMVENLLANAARYGQPPIVVSARPAADDMVDIEVSDAGDGVPEHMRDRLFERFATSGEGGGGTGLGLFIVRALARASGGDAWYDPDHASFVITLPAAPPELTGQHP